MRLVIVVYTSIFHWHIVPHFNRIGDRMIFNPFMNINPNCKFNAFYMTEYPLKNIFIFTSDIWPKCTFSPFWSALNIHSLPIERWQLQSFFVYFLNITKFWKIESEKSEHTLSHVLSNEWSYNIETFLYVLMLLLFIHFLGT